MESDLSYRSGMGILGKFFLVASIILCLALFYAVYDLKLAEKRANADVFPPQVEGYSSELFQNRPYGVRY